MDKRIEKRNIVKDVRLSGFIELDKDGEIKFYEAVPCPKCDGRTSGEDAGVFICAFCGFSPVEKYSEPHGWNLLLDHTWRFLRLFICCRRLRWMVSEKLWDAYSFLNHWYLMGRHRVSLVVDNYLWSWKEKRWIRLY